MLEDVARAYLAFAGQAMRQKIIRLDKASASAPLSDFGVPYIENGSLLQRQNQCRTCWIFGNVFACQAGNREERYRDAVMVAERRNVILSETARYQFEATHSS